MPNHPIIRFKKRVTTTPAAAPNGTASQKRRKSSMKQLVSQHRLSMPGISYAKAMEFPYVLYICVDITYCKMDVSF